MTLVIRPVHLPVSYWSMVCNQGWSLIGKSVLMVCCTAASEVSPCTTFQVFK